MYRVVRDEYVRRGSGSVDAVTSRLGLEGPGIIVKTVIVRESGGVVVDPSGEEMHLNARRVLCANSREIVEEFVAALETSRRWAG